MNDETLFNIWTILLNFLNWLLLIFGNWLFGGIDARMAAMNFVGKVGPYTNVAIELYFLAFSQFNLTLPFIATLWFIAVKSWTLIFAIYEKLEKIIRLAALVLGG